MIERNRTPDRDDVLFAFHQACERPTLAEINEWIARYPEFADDIRANAAIRLEWESNNQEVEQDEMLMANGRSRALNILHKLQQANADDEKTASAWSQMLRAAGFDVPLLARHIDIDRMVLAELNAGRMRPPLGQRLSDALVTALQTSVSRLTEAADELFAGPKKLGFLKAASAPTVNTRTYEEIVRASSMSEEQQCFWLGQD